MSLADFIMCFGKSKVSFRALWRRAVVWLIEAMIGFSVVAGTMILAALLLKACGVL